MPVAAAALAAREARCPSTHGRSPKPSSTASTATTRCSATAPARPSGISRTATGARSSSHRDRIDFYDKRVMEATEQLDRDFEASASISRPTTPLGAIKLHYIGLLTDHKQPECAETFFNSVLVRILNRAYFHNRFIFVRPAVSTEHIDADPPSYRWYYPLQQGLRAASWASCSTSASQRPFAEFTATSAACCARSARSCRARASPSRTTRSRSCRACSTATRPPSSPAA